MADKQRSDLAKQSEQTKSLTFYATLWFGDFKLEHFKIEPGREFAPITIIHPLGIVNMAYTAEGQEVGLQQIKKMTFEYRSRYTARHLMYIFAEET